MKRSTIAALGIVSVCSVIFISTKFSLHKEPASNNFLSSQIVMGDSLYTLSELNIDNNIFNSKYHLVFTGRIPDETVKDLESMKAFISLTPPPYVTFSAEGVEHRLEMDSLVFTHVDDAFKLEYYYKVPKDAANITVTLTYKNKEGKNAEFTTSPIATRK